MWIFFCFVWRPMSRRLRIGSFYQFATMHIIWANILDGGERSSEKQTAVFGDRGITRPRGHRQVWNVLCAHVLQESSVSTSERGNKHSPQGRAYWSDTLGDDNHLVIRQSDTRWRIQMRDHWFHLLRQNCTWGNKDCFCFYSLMYKLRSGSELTQLDKIFVCVLISQL